MLFEAAISASNIKHFNNVINFLLKIDNELIIELSNRGMTFRVLNDAKSAFVVVDLSIGNFFDNFILDSDEKHSCKIFGKVIQIYHFVFVRLCFCNL